jgi:hypothetical protein
MTGALELTTAEVVVGELRNHATRRSGSRAFRISLEARSEVGKKQPSYYFTMHIRAYQPSRAEASVLCKVLGNLKEIFMDLVRVLLFND